MTYYKGSPGSAISATEFIAAPKGNFTVFYGSANDTPGGFKARIESLGQTICAQASLNGKPVISSKGEKTQPQLMEMLRQQHQAFGASIPEKPFQPWKLRGYFSDAGMLLTLASVKFSGKALDASRLTFAALGLSANWVNKTYGAQKEDDPHRTAFIKEQINQQLAGYLPEGGKLSEIQGESPHFAKDAVACKSFKQKAQEFAQRHSVRLGEIGLRYMGSVAMLLSFPALRAMGEVRSGQEVVEKFAWSRAWNTLKTGSPKNAYGLLNEDKVNRTTGAVYLAGRTLSLVFSKTPDPYNPKPKTVLDNFREYYAFRASSVIEACAAATLALGNLKAHKATGKRDWLGGIGGASLMAGLITRLFAPFGTREVDMDALYAYTARGLAQMRADICPQRTMECAAILKQNLKDRPETLGDYIAELNARLTRENSIALPHELSKAESFEYNESKHSGRFAKPCKTHQEQVKQRGQGVMVLA